jgi:hypothetical protein
MLLPLLHRLLTATARIAGRTQQLTTELALAVHQPALERRTLDQQYATQRQYRAAKHQQQGFWPFEARMVADHIPPPPARLLLHGAGGGRELRALLALGYEVDAYEPVAELVAAANAGLAGSAPVQQATVQQWSLEATVQQRLLRPSGHYDAVITGWGMWTHVLQQADRLAALRAFLTVCPKGPVLLSFWRAGSLADHQERPQVVGPLHPLAQSRLQRISRQWLRQKVLRLEPLERGTSWRQGLYVHLVSDAELHEEAALAGYTVQFLESDRRRYGHAMLRPAAHI